VAACLYVFMYMAPCTDDSVTPTKRSKNARKAHADCELVWNAERRAATEWAEDSAERAVPFHKRN